jgi:hypothetical protein
MNVSSLGAQSLCTAALEAGKIIPEKPAEEGAFLPLADQSSGILCSIECAFKDASGRASRVGDRKGGA